jgi:uncharacterized protein (DUF1697 family)
MTKYVALLRGIGPGNPNIRNDKLNRDYTLLGMVDGAICSVIDLTSSQTPDLMLWLEKKFGKEITTRTWKTVERILKVME